MKTKQEEYAGNSEQINTLTNELAAVSEELETVKARMDERGNSMTDTSPLIKIKYAQHPFQPSPWLLSYACPSSRSTPPLAPTQHYANPSPGRRSHSSVVKPSRWKSASASSTTRWWPMHAQEPFLLEQTLSSARTLPPPVNPQLAR